MEKRRKRTGGKEKKGRERGGEKKWWEKRVEKSGKKGGKKRWEKVYPCSTSSAVLRALRRSDCFGWFCVLFNEILLPANLDQHGLHLVRNLIALFLLAACSVAVYLVHPVLIYFTLKRLLIIECCLELLRLGLRLELLLRRLLRLRNYRIDPCGESCYDDVNVLCVNFLLQELNRLHWLTALRCHVRGDALDLGCLVLDVRGNCLLLMAMPSACTCWTTASVLGCFGTGCSFPL